MLRKKQKNETIDAWKVVNNGFIISSKISEDKNAEVDGGDADDAILDETDEN